MFGDAAKDRLRLHTYSLESSWQRNGQERGHHRARGQSPEEEQQQWSVLQGGEKVHLCGCAVLLALCILPPAGHYLRMRATIAALRRLKWAARANAWTEGLDARKQGTKHRVLCERASEVPLFHAQPDGHRAVRCDNPKCATTASAERRVRTPALSSRTPLADLGRSLIPWKVPPRPSSPGKSLPHASEGNCLSVFLWQLRY